MRGRSLHVDALLLAAVTATVFAGALTLGSMPSALAANPNAPCNSLSAHISSCHFSGSFVDPAFCGTQQAVNVEFDGRFTIPLVPSASGGNWNNSEDHEVLTNLATGATVLIHSAYRFTGTLISGDPNGLHTIQAVFAGDAETIRDSDGGVIARDAGNLVVDATFNGDDFISAEIVKDSGGHSLFAGGDCSVLVSALGIT